jgi:hypothetical protein
VVFRPSFASNLLTFFRRNITGISLERFTMQHLVLRRPLSDVNEFLEYINPTPLRVLVILYLQK